MSSRLYHFIIILACVFTLSTRNLAYGAKKYISHVPVMKLIERDTIAPRRDLKTFSAQEWSDFIRAIQTLKNNGIYDDFTKLHYDVMQIPSLIQNETCEGVTIQMFGQVFPGACPWNRTHMMGMFDYRNVAHRGPAFLTFHRYLCLQFEYHVQQVLNDTSWRLPYWNWTRDADDYKKNSTKGFVPSFVPHMGGNGNLSVGFGMCRGEVTDSPFANWTLWKEGMWYTCNKLTRQFLTDQNSEIPGSEELKKLLSIQVLDYHPYNQFVGSFRNHLEGWIRSDGRFQIGMHNFIHQYVQGVFGTSLSANDPLFYVHHSYVDLLWEQWTNVHKNQPKYLTAELKNVPMHHGCLEKLLPWNEVTNCALQHTEPWGYYYENI